jgi:DNA-directed RNA polymerase subunit RPC12/RpoP
MGRIGDGFRRFMQGRHGTDKLNMWILGTGVVLCVLTLLIPIPQVDLLLTIISYGCMFWALFRMFSRNTYRRYQENRRFLQMLSRIKDRQHRYYKCPKCRQTVRVPKGKGKIAIACPKCKEKFIRKT